MIIRNLSNKKNITIGIILSFVTLFVSLIIHVFYTRFLVNSVGDTEYGIYSYAISITNWLTIFSSAVFSSYIRFVTIKQKEDGDCGVKTANSLFLFLFVVFDAIAIGFLAVIFVLLSNNVFEYQDKSLLTDLLFISGAQIILSIPSNIFALFITFKGKHIWIKAINLLGTILPPLISIPFLANGCRVTTVLIIQCLVLGGTYLLNFAFSVFHLKQSFAIGKKVFDKDFVKQVAVFSLFMILTEIVDKLNATSDQIILGSIDRGNYVSLVTVYQLSLSFSEFFASLSLAVVTVFVPMIHDSVINNKKEKTDRVFTYIYTLQMFVLFLFFGGFLSCGKEFITMWKPDHPEIFIIALILLFIRLVPLSQNASYEIQKAKNKYHFRSIINFVFAIINVGISIAFLFVLGFKNGIYACLIGTVFSTLVSKWFLISLYNSKSVGLDMKRYWLSLAKSLALTVFASFVAITIRQLLILAGLSLILRFLIVGSVFSIVFIALFFVAFSKDIIQITYTLLKKQNTLFFRCDKYMKKGVYRISPSLEMLYSKKSDALKISKAAFISKNLPFFKRLVSFFFFNYSRGNHGDCFGDVIYRSKNKLHIFDFERKRHYIIYDARDDLLKELWYRDKKYPYDKPRILFYDESELLLCEEILLCNENQQADIQDLLSRTLLSAKYEKANTQAGSDYFKLYQFQDIKIERKLYNKLFSQPNSFTTIALCYSHGDIAPGNLIAAQNKALAIDWEMAGLAPFYYDFLHYLMAEYIRTGNKQMIQSYFEGAYDGFLKALFELNEDVYNPSLREKYYYICVLTRLILFREKDGFQYEKALSDDEFWLRDKEEQ